MNVTSERRPNAIQKWAMIFLTTGIELLLLTALFVWIHFMMNRIELLILPALLLALWLRKKLGDHPDTEYRR